MLELNLVMFELSIAARNTRNQNRVVLLEL